MHSRISNLKPKKNIIALIGFMGVGKTSVGRGLSKKLNFSYIDSDNEIEKKKNMKINDIFEFYGENYFRELEQDIILEILSNGKNLVISLGGGSFLNIKVREEIKKFCLSIWLNANIDIIYKRIENSKNIRPLFKKILNKNAMEILLKKRSLIYQESDIKIDTNCHNKKKIVEDIINKLINFDSI